MYQLKLTSQAQRQLDKLPAEDRGRVVAALQQLGGNPRPSGAKKLRGFHIPNPSGGLANNLCRS